MVLKFQILILVKCLVLTLYCMCCAEPPLMSPGTTINQAQSLINFYEVSTRLLKDTFINGYEI